MHEYKAESTILDFENLPGPGPEELLVRFDVGRKVRPQDPW